MNFCPPSDSAATTGRSISSNGPTPGKRKGIFSFLSSSKQSSSRARYGDACDKLATYDDPKAQLFWLEELLPTDYPKARITAFGYDTVVTKGYRVTNKSNVFSHTKDLLYSLDRERSKNLRADGLFLWLILLGESS